MGTRKAKNLGPRVYILYSPIKRRTAVTAVKYEAKARNDDEEVDGFTLLEPLEKHGIYKRPEALASGI